MSDIVIHGLHKHFGNVLAVDGVDLTIRAGEFVTILGPSGCGKTTTLRCVAGLEHPDAGEIHIGDNVVFAGAKRRPVPPERRDVSMVFQTYALWPHMTVFDNVAYGLRRKRVPKSEVEQAVIHALEMVRLRDTRDRRISQLSGGQQQRIALARSIAYGASLVLFDEPLSNIDAKLRGEMRLELRELQQELGFTAIYVTHDQDEAMGLSDRVVVMNGGRIEQIDPPKQLYARPRTPFVAEFIGSSNQFDAVVAQPSDGLGHTVVRTSWTDELAVPEIADVSPGAALRVFARHADARLAPEAPADTSNTWPVRVVLESFLGAASTVKVRVDERAELIASVPHPQDVHEGMSAWLTLPPARIMAYPTSPAADEDTVLATR